MCLLRRLATVVSYYSPQIVMVVVVLGVLIGSVDPFGDKNLESLVLFVLVMVWLALRHFVCF